MLSLGFGATSMMLAMPALGQTQSQQIPFSLGVQQREHRTMESSQTLRQESRSAPSLGAPVTPAAPTRVTGSATGDSASGAMTDGLGSR
jgi:hypothetical protein